MVNFNVSIPNNLMGPSPSPGTLKDYSIRAEELGFHGLWALERLLHEVPTLEPISCLSLVAGVTSRVRLGSAVILSSLRTPVILAKQLATLDFLSNGRVTVGIGMGRKQDEFDAAGVNVKERVRRFIDGIQIMKKLWTEDNATLSTKLWNLNNASLNPKPIQKPHPPILIGGSADAVFRRAARLGDGWVSGPRAPESFTECWRKVLTHAKEFGRETDKMDNGALLYSWVDDDRTRARKIMSDVLTRYYSGSPPDIDKVTVWGRVSECTERVATYIKAGVKNIIFTPVAPDHNQLKIYAKEIIPSL